MPGFIPTARDAGRAQAVGGSRDLARWGQVRNVSQVLDTLSLVARGKRIAELAEELGAEVDEVLVTLWDCGVEAYDDPEDIVSNRDLRRVERALGIITHKERTTVAYWINNASVTREELTSSLAQTGIRLSPNSRRLPKGALRKLTKLYPSTQPEPDPIPTEVPDEERLRWELVGAERRDIRLLTLEEICSIHEALEEDFANSNDPIVPSGVRDQNLLASALLRATTSFAAERKYPTVEMSSAALFHSLIHNHPFFNGNKRTALVSLLAQLDENDTVLTASEKDLFRFTLRTAQHRLVSEVSDRPDRETLTIARWIRSNSRPVERGERPMRWRKLRQQLRNFNCEMAPAGGVGHRLNIKRVVPRHRRFGLGSKTRVLQTQVAWSGDGTDADRSTIHMLRKNLELDDEHDVDSATFYAGAKVDAFIIDYRRILGRLAKV